MQTAHRVSGLMLANHTSIATVSLLSMWDFANVLLGPFSSLEMLPGQTLCLRKLFFSVSAYTQFQCSQRMSRLDSFSGKISSVNYEIMYAA